MVDTFISEGMQSEGGDGPRTVHRQFDPGENDPVYNVVETVSELEGKPMEELPSIHDTLDGLIDRIYSNPPVTDVQAVIEFNYAGYRITLHQDGHATFIRVL